jgi:hypothetical protein
MEEDVEACVESALKDGLLRDCWMMAVCLLAEASCSEVCCDDSAMGNPPRPSCVGNRIIEVGRPCNYKQISTMPYDAEVSYVVVLDT